MVSLTLQAPTASRYPGEPGQYIAVRLPTPDGPALFRSYSLSGSVSADRYRISVKIEPHGVAGFWSGTRCGWATARRQLAARQLHAASGQRPVVLLSAGIGATPVMAMLYALAAARTARPVVWLYAARDGSTIRSPPRFAG